MLLIQLDVITIAYIIAVRIYLGWYEGFEHRTNIPREMGTIAQVTKEAGIIAGLLV